MSRLLSSLAVIVCLVSTLHAGDPGSDAVERALAVQKAMTAAQEYLTANMPAEAVAVLEAQVSNADGTPGFLPLLRRAYAADLKRLEANPQADAARVAELRRRLNLVGGPPKPENPWTGGTAAPPAAIPEPTPVAPAAVPAAAPAPAPSPAPDAAAEAAAEFKKGNYAAAARLYSIAAAGPAKLTPQQSAAWAYCRVKVAADALADPKCDPATAAALEKDVAEALQLAPQNPELQKVGQSVLALAKQRKGGASPAPVTPGRESAEFAGWDAIDTASFRVRFKGNREAAEALAKAAEEKRTEIFKRWSGPPAGAWQPRCEIVLHPTAECYTQMTKRPAQATGHATVRLSDGRVTERRIDLRADDAGLVGNALPRELTHVVLADLFPDRPPPKWAEEGMAVLAGSPDEVGRYVRTLPRCARDNELFPLESLLEMKDFPADRITGFYCESVAVADYLVRLGGERAFTVFLRDCHRYGTSAALKRNYHLDGPQALERVWKPTALDTTPRGQTP